MFLQNNSNIWITCLLPFNYYYISEEIFKFFLLFSLLDYALNLL